MSEAFCNYSRNSCDADSTLCRKNVELFIAKKKQALVRFKLHRKFSILLPVIIQKQACLMLTKCQYGFWKQWRNVLRMPRH